MIGDIEIHGDPDNPFKESFYIHVNDRGTLQKLPRIKSYWRRLWIVIRHRFKPLSVSEFIEACNNGGRIPK